MVVLGGGDVSYERGTPVVESQPQSTVKPLEKGFERLLVPPHTRPVGPSAEPSTEPSAELSAEPSEPAFRFLDGACEDSRQALLRGI